MLPKLLSIVVSGLFAPAVVLAQAVEPAIPGWASGLLGAGPIGAVVLYFLWQDNKRKQQDVLDRQQERLELSQQIQKMSGAVDRMTRGQIIAILSIKTLATLPGVRENAEAIVKEVDGEKT